MQCIALFAHKSEFDSYGKWEYDKKKKGVSAVGDLNRLKELVFATDNKACFIERDRVLARLRTEFEGYEKPDRFAKIFAALMEE